MDKKFIKIVPREIAILGIHNALAVAFIRGWIATNARNASAKKVERVWTFLTIEEWSEYTGVPKGTIKRHLMQLKKLGIIITGNFNRNRYLQTKWYRLADNYEQIIDEFGIIKFGVDINQIPPNDVPDLTGILDQNELVEKSNTTYHNDSNDPMYEYNKECNKEYTNETTRQIDNSSLEETVINNSVENSIDAKSKNKINEFKQALINFQRNIDRKNSKLIDISINDALNEIVKKYGANEGLDKIYEFVFNDISSDKGHILQNLCKIKSNINRII
jgi:DNA-binding transcriptional ArsR family regulator